MSMANTTSQVKEEFDPINGPEFEGMVISPKLAEDMLRFNKANRPLRSVWVDILAERIKRGQWKYNGETIKFGTDGILLDGQYRLSAVIKASKPIYTAVQRGLSPDIFHTLDTGKKRSPADTLALIGEQDVTRKASILRLLHMYYETGSLAKSSKVSKMLTNEDYIWLVDKFNLVKALQFVNKIKRAFPYMRPSVTGFCAYLFLQISEEDTKVFFELLSTGMNVQRDFGIINLRDKMIFAHANKHNSISTERWCALTIKVWNAFREGRTLKKLVYSDGNVFPKPV